MVPYGSILHVSLTLVQLTGICLPTHVPVILWMFQELDLFLLSTTGSTLLVLSIYKCNWLESNSSLFLREVYQDWNKTIWSDVKFARKQTRMHWVSRPSAGLWLWKLKGGEELGEIRKREYCGDCVPKACPRKMHLPETVSSSNPMAAYPLPPPNMASDSTLENQVAWYSSSGEILATDFIFLDK